MLIGYLITAVAILKNLLLLAILLRSIASSFIASPFAQRGRLVEFLYDSTDPFINMARKLPHRISMIDLSPMIAMIMVDLGGRLLIILLSKLV